MDRKELISYFRTVLIMMFFMYLVTNFHIAMKAEQILSAIGAR
jgi:hypothetical protein